MAKPTVSVVIATYNYGRFLTEAIESVLAQSYKDYEIVAIDDGSSDNTRRVVEPYLALPNFFCHHLKKNIGQPRAKNLAIRQSRGEFIAFLDGDDVWLPEKLEKQIRLFERSKDVGVVYSDFVWFRGDRDLPELGHPPYARGCVTRNLILDNIVPFSSSVVRRECFAKNGMFDESIPVAIDYDLWLRLSLNWAFDYVPEKLVRIRVGHTRLSSRSEERMKIARRITQRFLSAHKERIDPSESLRRQDLALTYLREGYYNHRIGRRLRALRCYRRSLSALPFQLRVWKAILTLSLPYHVIETLKRKNS